MDKVWYYMKKDKSKYGPYSDSEVRALIRQGIIEKDEYIWMTDMKGWLKVENSIYSIFVSDEEEMNGETFM